MCVLLDGLGSGFGSMIWPSVGHLVGFFYVVVYGFFWILVAPSCGSYYGYFGEVWVEV